MIVECCVCKIFIVEKQPLSDTSVTHSFCDEHFAELLAKIAEDDDSWLASQLLSDS